MENLRKEMLSRWNSDGWEYDSVAAHGINDEDDRTRWQKILMNHKKELLLDVGTGTGFLSILASEIGLITTGADWSETMLSQARQKAEQKNLAVNFVQGNIESLPFTDQSFDLITSRHVIWTLADPLEAFKEWLRLLKPGGVLYADYSPRKGNSHHGHHYDIEVEKKLPLNADVPAQQIENLFASAGFSRTSYDVLERKISHGDHTHTKELFMFTCVK